MSNLSYCSLLGIAIKKQLQPKSKSHNIERSTFFADNYSSYKNLLVKSMISTLKIRQLRMIEIQT